jgi:4-hydroxy 2-oxovalerate aldolase
MKKMKDKEGNIKILDCTLRDGGLLNKFKFEDDYIRAHIMRLSQAGADYIELGYKCSSDLFDENEFGKLKFCRDSFVKELLYGLEIKSKLAFMVDCGRFDIEEIRDAKESPFKMARVACYLRDLNTCIEDVKTLNQKGYETMINIMAISKENEDDLKGGLNLIAQEVPFCGVYIVDSFGAYLPQNILKLVKIYKKILGEAPIGIHAHNNMQLVFANTILAMQHGVSYVDASVNGMGRGAGNCPIELLMPIVNQNKYSIKPVLKLSDEYYDRFRDNLFWGFSNKGMLTGLFNVHPVESIKNHSNYSYSLFDELKKEVFSSD